MPRQYSVQFRDRFLDLVEQGRYVGEVAIELGIGSATIIAGVSRQGLMERLPV